MGEDEKRIFDIICRLGLIFILTSGSYLFYFGLTSTFDLFFAYVEGYIFTDLYIPLFYIFHLVVSIFLLVGGIMVLFRKRYAEIVVLTTGLVLFITSIIYYSIHPIYPLPILIVEGRIQFVNRILILIGVSLLLFRQVEK